MPVRSTRSFFSFAAFSASRCASCSSSSLIVSAIIDSIEAELSARSSSERPSLNDSIRLPMSSSEKSGFLGSGAWFGMDSWLLFIGRF